MIFSKIKSILSYILNVRIYTNIPTLLIIIFGIYVYHLFLLKEDESNLLQNDVVKHIDSLNNANKILFSKLDSLDLNKKEKIKVYHTTTLKYDTLKILVDSMPPIDATLFLLSKSRQLTDKGIE
jgi:hypothetical protein